MLSLRTIAKLHHAAGILLCCVLAVCAVVMTSVVVRGGQNVDSTLPAIASSAKSLTGTLNAGTTLISQGTQTLKSAQGMIDTAQGSFEQLTSTIHNANLAAIALQRPCMTRNDESSPFFTPYFSRGSVMPCGTFSDVSQTLHTVRGTFGTVERAGNHFDRSLTTLDAQENTLFNDFDSTGKKLPSLVQSYTMTAQQINEWLAGKDLAEIGANTASMSNSGALVMSDFQKRFHVILYPPPCHKLGCLGKYAWPVLKATPAFGQSLYWTKQLLDNATPR